MIRRVQAVGDAGLWLFAAVAVLSIAAQNVFWPALAAWLFERLWLRRRFPALPSLGWVWLAFMAWALLASFHSENAAASLDTWKKWVLAVAAWCTADYVRDRRQLSGLLGTLLLCAALVNLGAVLWFGSQPLAALAGGKPWSEVAYHWVYDTEWRARGGSGGYMVLSALDALLLGLFAGLAALEAAWRRPAVWACLGLVALGLLFTLTRGAWIGAAAGVGLVALRVRPRWVLAALALAAALWLAFPRSVFVQRLATVADTENDSNRERYYMLQSGLAIVRQNPVLGVGDAIHSWEAKLPDGSTRRVDGWFFRTRSAEALAWYTAKGVPDRDNGHLHDTPLQLAAMYGLPGLGLAALFFAGLFAWGWARSRDAALSPLGRGCGLGLCAGLLALAVHSMTEYNLGSFQTGFTLWFVIGLAAAGVRLGAAENA